jgi:hypothetical protein
MDLQTIKLIGGATVKVDMDSHAKCRSCEALIKYGATKNNKLIPIIEARPGKYKAHFEDCVDAPKWRRNSLSNRINGESPARGVALVMASG